jgi:hypothetical protein
MTLFQYGGDRGSTSLSLHHAELPLSCHQTGEAGAEISADRLVIALMIGVVAQASMDGTNTRKVIIHTSGRCSANTGHHKAGRHWTGEASGCGQLLTTRFSKGQVDQGGKQTRSYHPKQNFNRHDP